MKTTALISLLAVLAVSGRAEAIVVPPSCSFDARAQQITDMGRGQFDVYPNDVGNGFVSSMIYDADAGETAILQSCTTGDYLIVAYSEDQIDAVTPIYEEMVYGRGQYTLRQIGEALGALGAAARLGQNDMGDCACDIYYGTDE
ncbi:hypothetical protein [Octadecabacter sp. R77987]|uniref:hypothetical protein n=1 Tax=Octadecabacter sp. R77987 TaxID=3093874 RepID=UPI00366E39AF